MKFISNGTPPQSESLSQGVAKYYLVDIEGYGVELAMYMKDDSGVEDWYSSYTSKIFRNVTQWLGVDTKLKS